MNRRDRPLRRAGGSASRASLGSRSMDLVYAAVAAAWDRGESATPRELNQTASCSAPSLPLPLTTLLLPPLDSSHAAPLFLSKDSNPSIKLRHWIAGRWIRPSTLPFPARPQRRSRLRLPDPGILPFHHGSASPPTVLLPPSSSSRPPGPRAQ